MVRHFAFQQIDAHPPDPADPDIGVVRSEHPAASALGEGFGKADQHVDVLPGHRPFRKVQHRLAGGVGVCDAARGIDHQHRDRQRGEQFGETGQWRAHAAARVRDASSIHGA